MSKRELYALVGNKQEMLIACISERAKRFDVPADLPVLRDRETLAQVLASFGTKVVREASAPTVIAVFRLAISEVIQSPEVARALDSISDRSGNFEIYVRRIEGGQEVNITNNSAQDIQPAISPDGTSIAFVSTRSSRTGLVRIAPPPASSRSPVVGTFGSW